MSEPDEPKWKAVLRAIGWRRCLAIALWALCVLGSFLPTSSSVVVYPFVGTRIYPAASTVRVLIGITIPLVIILVGSWLLDDDDSGIKRGFGIAIELYGWVQMVYLIGLYLLGPLILMVS